MRNKKNRHSTKSTNPLNVVCPTCGAWTGKSCKHTRGSRKGKKRSSPHGDRVRLAKVKLSDGVKERLKKGAEPYESPKEKKIKAAKGKLAPEQMATMNVILEHIERLGKHAEFVGPVTKGPLVETYRFLPLRRTKVQHLEGLRKDIAVQLAAEDVVIKRMPGEQAVGFFVPIPKDKRKKIDYRETLASVVEYMQDARDNDGDPDWHLPIPLNFGVDSDGKPFIDDMVVLPHLLTAGTTGGGKSTWVRSALQSIFWTMGPDELRAYISDTKGTEFKHFGVLPHLMEPIATDLYTTMNYFQKCIDETDTRLKLFAMKNVTNIHEYNAHQPEGQKMPYILLIIDELADLMGTAIEKAEAKMNADKLSAVVARSRAAGIFVLGSTQRPDVKQVKGSIKANFPARLSFRLPSSSDSKTILNTKGAEALMMRGDMLYISSASPDLKRLHSPFLSLDDSKEMIKNIVQRYATEQVTSGSGVQHETTLRWQAGSKLQ